MADQPAANANSPGFFRDVFQSRYREATLSSLIFGVVLGVIMNASITYAGLKIGFTIVGSAIAAVLGFGVLRGLLRQGSILEVNITQTVASAVNTSCAGIIFTVPALFLLGSEYSERLAEGGLDFWLLTLACTAGGVLGVAFIIPLRKQMIDIERLRFPSGTAVAAILRSPGAGAKKSVVLLVGAVVAALIYLPVALPNIRVKAPLEELNVLVENRTIKPAEAERTRLVNRWLTTRTLPPELIEQGAAVARTVTEKKVAEGKLTPEQKLALMAYRVSRGERSWKDLEDAFWAKKPLWGYGSLGWRLPDPRADKTQRLDESLDHDRDGKPDLVLTDSKFSLGRLLGLPDYLVLVFAITPLSFGAGYLTGRPGLFVLAGGVLAYLFLTPAAYQMGWMPASLSAHEAVEYGKATVNRPLGIGMLVGGALMGVVFALPAIREAIRSVASAGRARGGSDELSLRVLLVVIAAGALLLFLAADILTGADESAAPPATAQPANPPPSQGLLGDLNPHLRNAILALVGIAWIWFAGMIIAQCTGMTDWSPVSGMALLTVVLVMLLIGTDAVIGAVLFGAALCVSLSLAADMMADLKTGYLVGAQPRRQQVVELLTAGIGPVVSMATLLLIVELNMQNTGVPIGPGTDTPAPQGQALAAVIDGGRGGEMPYALYGAGAVLGILLGLGAFPGLGVLVGLSMYLPLEYVLTYGLGCVANMLVGRVKGRTWAEEWGVPFCAGLIVGEAILAMIVNIVALAIG